MEQKAHVTQVRVAVRAQVVIHRAQNVVPMEITAPLGVSVYLLTGSK